MSEDRGEQAVKANQEEMADEAGQMETRLEEFDEHAEEAEKKAEHTRAHTSPDSGDEPPGDTAGDREGMAGDDEDPSGAVDPPSDDEQ